MVMPRFGLGLQFKDRLEAFTSQVILEWEVTLWRSKSGSRRFVSPYYPSELIFHDGLCARSTFRHLTRWKCTRCWSRRLVWRCTSEPSRSGTMANSNLSMNFAKL